MKRKTQGAIVGGLTFLSMLGAAVPAQASGAGPTSATAVLAAVDGHVYFNGEQGRGTRPGCAIYPRWAINVTTPTGQALLSVLMTGIALGKTFWVTGVGTCEFDSELVYAIQYAN